MSNSLRTRAMVLRRTNYGESDRILTLLTPEGQKSVLAKGVRKEKSRLAGGIELFSISDVVIQQGQRRLGILTSAKMLKFFPGILTDLGRLELASRILKRTNQLSEQIDSPELFELVEQAFTGIESGINLEVVETWFLINLARVGGETMNVFFDINGDKLQPDQNYHWNELEKALSPQSEGEIGAEEIKLLRLLSASSLSLMTKVNKINELITPLKIIAKSLINK
ncbi:MAG: DNA repair protein RecO [Candidatus Saccharibacteria bacterium]|nr:DNA repair protein RecO [Candidatus Saccharibacteria bacterium]